MPGFEGVPHVLVKSMGRTPPGGGDMAKYPREVKRCIDEITELISSNYEDLKDEFPYILSDIKSRVEGEILSSRRIIDRKKEYDKEQREREGILAGFRSIEKQLDNLVRSRRAADLGFYRPLKPTWAKNINGVVEIQFPGRAEQEQG
jgi:hypothetical protein